MRPKSSATLIALTIMFIAAMSVVMVPPVSGQFGPPPAPPFSRDIQPINPSPFETCLIGQFEPSVNQIPGGHLWYIRTEGPGNLTIDVKAVGINAQESGSVRARVFDNFTQIGFVEVFHPTGFPPTVMQPVNVGSIVVPAPAVPTIYRLEIEIGPATAANTMPAHHYKLGFSGVPADVGINSPSFRYFEHEMLTQTFHVNVGAGEDLDFSVFTETPNQGANQSTTMRYEVRRRDNNALLGTWTGAPAPSLDAYVPNPFGGASGTLLVNILQTDGHFRMAKRNGGDRGVYFDSCTVPPPPPPSNAVARTIGYWKNHPEAIQALPPQTLGNYVVNDVAKARQILDAAHARNAYEMLAAQLLATRLNMASGVFAGCVIEAVHTANHMLEAANYAGPNTTSPPTDKDAVLAVKDILDNFNNRGCPAP